MWFDFQPTSTGENERKYFTSDIRITSRIQSVNSLELNGKPPTPKQQSDCEKNFKLMHNGNQPHEQTTIHFITCGKPIMLEKSIMANFIDQSI